jgi:futalosine hydrolase
VVDCLITGPGIHATVYYLTKQLTAVSYHLALNLGVCGSLDRKMTPVRLVRVTGDRFADLGAEDGNRFLDLFELGLAQPNRFPFRNGVLKGTVGLAMESLTALTPAEGITVQKAHGAHSTVAAARKRFGPVVESMEGAAFFYTCLMEKTPCVQVRAVSNLVERRNRSRWKLKEAADALSGFAALFLLEWALKNAGPVRKIR